MNNTERLAILSEQIDRALAAKLVYNPEYNGMKMNFSRLLDDMERETHRVWLDQRPEGPGHGYGNSDAFQEIYYFHPMINSFGKFNRLLVACTKDAMAVKETDLHVRMLAVIAAFEMMYQAFQPLAEKLNTLKPFIIMGRKPGDTPRLTDPRTLDHTGTCPVCGRNIKLEDMTMVMHGYDVQHGFQHGRCFGVGRAPIEVSPEGLGAYIGNLKRHMNVDQDIVAADGQNAYHLRDGKKISRGEPGFEKLKNQDMARLRGEIAAIKADLRYREQQLAEWAPRPLPDGDARHLEAK